LRADDIENHSHHQRNNNQDNNRYHSSNGLKRFNFSNLLANIQKITHIPSQKLEFLFAKTEKRIRREEYGGFCAQKTLYGAIKKQVTTSSCDYLLPTKIDFV
jgi:hypothetical protein